MLAHRRVLAIIPARGGSVGLPRKNVRPLAGLPLIAYPIRTARACTMIDRAIVSTDDEEIADVARRLGAEVPFRRPTSLARNSSRMFDVLVHAVEHLEAAGDQPYDDIVLLQPTSPFREVEDVERCLRTLWTSGADSVITVYRHPQVHPRLMYSLAEDGTAVPVCEATDRMPQRQELDPVFIRTGIVYAFRRRLLHAGGDIYGRRTLAVEIPFHRAFSIDDATDFAICEHFAREAPDVSLAMAGSPEPS